jgi:hypothetical protein
MHEIEPTLKFGGRGRQNELGLSFSGSCRGGGGGMDRWRAKERRAGEEERRVVDRGEEGEEGTGQPL